MELKIGQKVLARFTNNFNVIEFKGVIVKLNKWTARVRSLEDGVNGWGVEKEFVIQLEGSLTHSTNNCIVRILDE